MKTLSYLMTTLLLSACSTAAISNPAVIHSDGVSFFPLQTAAQQRSTANSTSANTLGLYKGQAMQAVDSYVTGTLTGVILVKTGNQDSVLRIPAQQAIRVGQDFVLLSFDENTDLLATLAEINKHPDVETAEIEVNTRRRKPR